MSKIACLFIALSFLAIPLIAQETAKTCGTSSLYGRVKSSNPKRTTSTLGTINVTALTQINNYRWDTEEVQRESYCVKVPVTSIVFLHFQGDGIDPLDSIPVNTGISGKKHSWLMPLAELDPVEAKRTAQSTENQNAQQERQIVRAKLLKHQASLDLVDSKDLFIWNIELYKDVYRNDPEATAEINQFISELKANPRYDFLRTKEYERKTELFKFIIARNQSRSTQIKIKPIELTALIEDSNVFPGIRANAISALSTFTDLQGNEKEQVVATLSKALENDVSMQVRLKAAEALGAVDAEKALHALKKASEEDDSLEVRFAAKAAIEQLAIKQFSPNNLNENEVHPVIPDANMRSVPSGQKLSLKGVVIRREADTFTVRDANGVDTNVRLTSNTSVKTKGSFLRSGTNYGVTSILRGLNLEVEGRGDSTGALIAEKVRFNDSGLSVARSIDTRVNPVEDRGSTTETRVNQVEQNAQRMSGQIDELAGVSNAAKGGANVATGNSDTAVAGVNATNERISALDDYVPQETTAINFRVGSEVLSAQAKTQLSDIATKAMQAKGFVIEVSGFTDASGGVDANRRLSQRRADAVVRFLVENHRIPLRRIVTPFGYGESQSVADNRTREGRAQNRRVEVKILVNRGLTQPGPSISTPASSNIPTRNSYGVWTAIEYPELKEVVVALTPSGNFSTAFGQANVMRRGDHTTIEIYLSGLPTNITELYLYAIVPAGRANLIGPVTISNGMASQMSNTPLDKFMLVLSPDASLTNFGPDTKVAFRSVVPDNFAVVTPTGSPSSSSSTEVSEEKKKGGTLSSLKGGRVDDKSAELTSMIAPGRDRMLFEEATKQVRKSSYDTGRLLYNTLITTYPDSPFLPVSKLAIADTFYLEGTTSALSQASIAYQDWLVLFPTDPLADDVMLKMAESEMRQMGLADRDVSHARKAEQRLKVLMQQFPNTALRADVELRLREVQENLGMHTMKVGDFYYERNRQQKGGLKGAQSRYREVTEKYPFFSYMDKVLFRLANTYLQEEEPDEAAKFFQRIVRDYPNSEYVQKAREQLEVIGAEVPTPNPQRVNLVEPDRPSVTQNLNREVLSTGNITVDKNGVLISKDKNEGNDLIDKAIQRGGTLLEDATPNAPVQQTVPAPTLTPSPSSPPTKQPTDTPTNQPSASGTTSRLGQTPINHPSIYDPHYR